MVQRLKTKQDIRKQMEAEISEFIHRGGEIQEIEKGISGREDNANLNQAIPLTQGDKQTLTLLNDTVKAIDERKQKNKSLPTPEKHTPKKRIIYDDFGEPIREVWE